MKLQLAKLSITIASILIYSDALAFQRDGKVYMDLNLGYGFTNTERNIGIGSINYNFKQNNKGVIGEFGIGYHLLDEIRVGVSVLYTPKLRGSKSNGTLYSEELKEKKMGVFANAYYDFLTGSRFNPFLLVGIGSMRTEYKETLTMSNFTDHVTKSKTKMAYKLGAGLSYHINTSMDLDFTYQAIMNGSSKKKNNVSLKYTGPLLVIGPTTTLKPAMVHSLMIGLRYTF